MSDCWLIAMIVIKCTRLPFPNGNLDTDATVIYGLADMGTGVVGAPLKRGPYPLEKHTDALKFPQPHYATGDSPVDIVRGSVDGIVDRYGGSNVIYGGAGNKILASALVSVNLSNASISCRCCSNASRRFAFPGRGSL